MCKCNRVVDDSDASGYDFKAFFRNSVGDEKFYQVSSRGYDIDLEGWRTLSRSEQRERLVGQLFGAVYAILRQWEAREDAIEDAKSLVAKAQQQGV